ncbi:hypothetical protein [Streptomyces murinus]|uniref:hypothetical protein n=1 Tax=Streptomyces murinus TaxID=33900 RepID=UPI00381AEF26
MLAHKKINNGPTDLLTTYDKTGGSAVSIRLGYSMSGSTTYSSYFTMKSGQSAAKSWKKSGNYMCYSSVGVLNYSGGTYQTPTAHC